MDNEKSKDSEMRKKAEEILQGNFNPIKYTSKNVDEVIYELRVHQIELEMQNEELRVAQLKLEDSKHKYFDLYNYAPVGYFTLNKDGIILDVNLAGALLLGVERLNLQKSAFIQYIDPACRNEFHHHIMNVKKQRKDQTANIKLLKMNDPFYAHLETVKVLDNEGNLIEFRMSVFDINELKTTEEALKQIKHNLELKVEERTQELKSANEYNRSLIEASLDPLVTIGPDGKITDVNSSTEKFTGCTRNELIGSDFSDYFTEPEKAREGYQQVFKEGYVLDYPLEIKNKNRHTTPVLYNATVYKNKFNEVIGVFAAARDITGIKKAERKLIKYQDTLEKKVNERTKALKQSNKELKEFAYVASHDLKEPLRMITTFLQLLERRYKDKLDNEANDFIRFAVEGSKRMDNMINDLLEYSRIGNQEREFEYLQSEKLLDTVLMNLKSSITDTNAIITHDPLPLIFANEQLMIQLFQNIISNSIKYHGEKNPEIHISTDNANDEYIFIIKDNGIGMNQNHLKKIFTIFQRLHTREEYEGTGIGLAIVQKIVQKHRGKIWVESELGKGTTFYFTIPNKNY
ncbi:PAS/PAC sensor signal transduction histidine kinase [Methanobacterium lacus]|uniref:histidine kinase n=1 Tax=Methanobacterium lacus (strain AL-21) TaxID=877455 RepID=F0TA48_METLA|nr:ATP-binding protein [Methanobacterium lacus]ADZ09998.1 PAS/PAC sensor signal transduction histidine kinase [Methanobacterium lacus]